MNTTLSGCQALEGCEKKDQCLRYQHFLDNKLIGFHAYQSCKLSEFTEKRYLHLIEITPEVALDELVRLSEELGLYDYDLQANPPTHWAELPEPPQ